MDWEGNPHNKFVISDKYDLDYITVDEMNKTIYGISYNKDKAYKFNFGKSK